MSAITFAIAYHNFLCRIERGEREPVEPRPEDYGLPPDVDARGRVVAENPLAEPLRLAVWRDWEGDEMKKVKGREHLSLTK